MIYFLKEIAMGHEKLFPVADLDSQIRKFEEEIQEYKVAETRAQREKELADCLIVCAGIYRFSKVVGKMLANEVMDEARIWDLDEVYLKALKKWEINKSRKWEYKDGVYHHIGVDGNE